MRDCTGHVAPAVSLLAHDTPLTVTGGRCLLPLGWRAEHGLYDHVYGAAAGADDLYGDLYDEHGDEGHTLLKEKNAQVGFTSGEPPLKPAALGGACAVQGLHVGSGLHMCTRKRAADRVLSVFFGGGGERESVVQGEG